MTRVRYSLTMPGTSSPASGGRDVDYQLRYGGRKSKESSSHRRKESSRQTPVALKSVKISGIFLRPPDSGRQLRVYPCSHFYYIAHDEHPVQGKHALKAKHHCFPVVEYVNSFVPVTVPLPRLAEGFSVATISTVPLFVILKGLPVDASTRRTPVEVSSI